LGGRGEDVLNPYRQHPAVEVLAKHLHPAKFFKIDHQTALWNTQLFHFSPGRFGEYPKII
jgi:hypothetical protein